MTRLFQQKSAWRLSAASSLLFLLLLFAGHPMLAQDHKPASPAASVEELETRIRAILEEADVPGMTGALVYGDEVVWQWTYGVADRQTKRPVTPQTRFRVGSISKTFVSLAVMKLVERGQLRLSDPVATHVPELEIPNRWKDTDPVRLEHVLEHSAGFDDAHLRGLWSDEPGVTTRGGIELNKNSLKVRWRPGTRTAYSNVGPPVAALAVENVTGGRFEDFVEREVFEALGMRTATYFHDDSIASGHRSGKPLPYNHISLRASGSVSVTTADMVRLIRLFNNRGRLDGAVFLQPESLKRMETPSSTLAARNGLRVGAGPGLFSTQYEGFLLHLHGGGIKGFVSRFGYLPEHGRGYFLSINSGNSEAIEQILTEVFLFMAKDLTPRTPPEPVRQPEDSLHALDGFYVPDAPRNELMRTFQSLMPRSVEAADGGIRFGGSAKMHPLGGNRFIREGEVLPSLVFVTTPDGELLAQGALSTLRREDPFTAWGRLAAVVFAGLMVLTTFAFAPFWGIRWLSGRLRNPHFISVRAMPLIGATVLLLPPVLLLFGPFGPDQLIRPTAVSVFFWLCSLMFPLFAVVSLLHVLARYRYRRAVGQAVWYHSLLTSVALIIIAVLMGSSGLIGLQLWEY